MNNEVTLSFLENIVSNITDLSFVFRANKPAEWNNALEHAHYIPVSYKSENIDYQLAYQEGHGGIFFDLSMIIYWDNKPVGVWPLTCSIKGGRASLSSQGLPVMPPLLDRKLPLKSIKTVIKSCLDIAQSLAKELNIDNWISEEFFREHSGFSQWHLQSMARGAYAEMSHDLYLDLRPNLTEIKRVFRSRYKSLINSGLRCWKVEIISDENTQKRWQEYQNLHFKVAGRATRTQESWDLQLKHVKQGQSFLVYLLDQSNNMVGGGLFTCSREEGCYAVGAYDRSLFDKPLGHVVQFRAIQEMKSRGLHWYRIGKRFFRNDVHKPTEKEISIAEFKNGFASHVFPAYILNHYV